MPHLLSASSNARIIKICVLVLLYVSSYCYVCVLILLYECPRTAMYVPSYCYACVLILPYMCPRTAMYVSSFFCMRASHYTSARAATRGTQFTCFTGTNVQILTREATGSESCNELIIKVGGAPRLRYSLYLLLQVQQYVLYRYKSTNTDAPRRASQHRR